MKVVTLILSLFLFSCSNQSLDDYKNEEPQLNLKEFFNGKLYAKGIVQDRSGKVIKRFYVDMKATWKADVCKLEEKFQYSDNTKSSRIWELKEMSDKNYLGRAHDVIDMAHGKVLGNTFYFQYKLNLPVGDDTYKVNFEDWMYMLDKKTLLARSYMSKWGFKVGEVILIMVKQEE